MRVSTATLRKILRDPRTPKQDKNRIYAELLSRRRT